MAAVETKLISASDARRALDGRSLEVLQAVERAYLAHLAGRCYVPHSTFLRLDNPARIIGLPAWLDLQKRLVGVKWVASFPSNLERGLERASAIIIVNSPVTGHVEAIIEGSLINRQRTAGSAVLAIRALRP